MALIMAGLIAGVIAGDNGRNGYWLAFPPTSTHWKYGTLPVKNKEIKKELKLKVYFSVPSFN